MDLILLTLTICWVFVGSHLYSQIYDDLKTARAKAVLVALGGPLIWLVALFIGIIIGLTWFVKSIDE